MRIGERAHMNMPMPPVTIRHAQDAQAASWDAFVENHPQSTFFHRFGWSRIICECYGHAPHYLVAERQGRIVGVLPLTDVKSPFFGRSLISTAFTVGGGILAADEIAAEALAAEAERLGAEAGVNYVELRGGDDRAGWQTKDSIYAGFAKDMAQGEEENLTQIPRKKRADVRKGIKAAQKGLVRVEVSADTERFYRLYAASLRAHGTPIFPRKYVDLLMREFSQVAEISFVSEGNMTVGTLLSFYHRGTVLPYYNGAAPIARKLHAVDYLYWRQMRHAVEERGATRFDFGRSKFGTGPFDYKTYWGFEPCPLRYHYKLVKADALPDINPNNPKFRLVTKIWQHLPLGVANRIGPILAGNLA